MTAANFEITTGNDDAPAHAIIVGPGPLASKYFPELNLANFGPEAITMVTNNNTVKAQPTAISGGSFAVVWHHA